MAVDTERGFTEEEYAEMRRVAQPLAAQRRRMGRGGGLDKCQP